MSMDIPLIKLKAILLYFATHTNPKYLGKTKLMKLFYFLDFTHVKKHAVPITYDTYYHLEHGPVPTVIMNMINLAIDDPKNSPFLDTITFEKAPGIDMVKIKPARQFTQKDESLFSRAELETLKQIAVDFENKETKYLEELSHSESGWKNTQPRQTISYEHAALDKDSQVSKEEIILGMSLAS